ncbi:phage tail tape measure protein [Candidatus Formimonas warabiya]|uniref:Phage tail tape measure protein n=1 Tax=Formimonas warabiya TaxID=1761012 RepID=A0A3G1KNZ1_FORW1|nr:phage tail tape measure protein [Candidatus Formimonas warabiya]ATW24179.1 phage tail tape measure protein [Candidatus Formimonas warabiya]
MSEAVLQATIRAFDEFSALFQKFQQELQKTEQAEKQVETSTVSVNQAMGELVKAKNRAREATESFNRILAEMARGEKQGIDITKQFDAAFTEFVAAEKAVEQETNRLNQVFAQNGVAGKQAQTALKQVDQALDGVDNQAKQAHRSTSDFLQTIGQLGALYSFKRGLEEVLITGREFERTITQAQVIVGDFSDTLEESAMSMKDSIFLPRQVAEAYRELGAAGLETNEVLMSSPDIMNFATAAMIDMTSSAEATIAAVKGFNLSFEQSEDVVDAFSVAMDKTTLAGEDFVRALASVGPVAGGLAKQSLEDTLSLVAALKDMGASAEDSSTSVRSMLLQLINPTREAQETLEALSISLYDSAGNMKSLPDIIAQFEVALAGYNERSRQLIMTTVAGSDGIRALAAGLSMGSDRLKELSRAMAEGQGRAAEYASIMGDTFDGSVRKAAASWERLKIAMFESASPKIMDLLNGITALVDGFNSLDESTQKVIESLVGNGGFIVALGLATAMLRTFLITLGLAAGPAGIAALVTTGLIALTGVIIGITGAQQSAKQAQDEANKSLAEYQKLIAGTATTEEIKNLDTRIEKLKELTQRYDELKKKMSEPTTKMVEPTGEVEIVAFGRGGGVARTVADGMREVNAELEKLGLTYEKAQEVIAAYSREQEKATLLDYQSAVATANSTIQKALDAKATSSLMNEYLRLTANVKSDTDVAKLSIQTKARLSTVVDQLSGSYGYLVSAIDGHGKAMLLDREGVQRQIDITSGLAQAEMAEARTSMETQRQKTQVVIEETKTRLKVLLEEQNSLFKGQLNYGDAFVTVHRMEDIQAIPGLQEQLNQAQQAALAYEKAISALNNMKPVNLGGISGAGTKTWTPPETDKKSSSENKGLEEAKGKIEYITSILSPFKDATEAAANAVSILGAKEQYLFQVMESGQGTLLKAAELNKIRIDQVGQLGAQQQALHKENNEYEYQLQKLRELEQAYKAANNPEAAKEVRSEIDNITRSIAQNSQAWWQLEQTQFQINQKIAQEQEKKYNDAYQQAMDLMRHEINMASMSADQQIAYLEKVRERHEWTEQQKWQLEEQLYNLRRQQLSKYLEKLDEAYQDQVDDINKKVEKKIEKLQDQIDSLDEEDTSSDREETERQHNQKIADLQEEYNYHDLRTGKEHEEKKNEILEQIAEENHQWELQQQKWEREDQKKHLQEQIDQTREWGEEEKEELQEHYDEAQKIAEESILDTIAALAATNPEWQKTGEDLIDALIEGLETGDYSGIRRDLERIKEEFEETFPGVDPDVPDNEDEDEDEDEGSSGGGKKKLIATITPDKYEIINNQAAMAARALGDILNKKVEWKNGQVVIGGEEVDTLKNVNGTAYVSIREAAEALGYTVDWNKSDGVKIYKAALGGIFTQPSLAMIREAGEDEAVLPLKMLQPMIDEAMQKAMAVDLYEAIRREVLPKLIISGFGTGGAGAGGVIYQNNYNAPLYGTDKTYINDETDARLVAREIYGLQQSALRVRGAKGK